MTLSPGAKNTKWTVRDGVLLGTGDMGYLVTRRSDYQNFRVRVEARISNGGNSGLFFRVTAPVPDKGGYQAQISDSTDRDRMKTGSLAYYSSTPGVGKRPVVLKESPVPPAQWFTMEVICEGPRIRIIVDGKETADQNLSSKGAIALEAFHTAPVEFRKVQVKELPPSK